MTVLGDTKQGGMIRREPRRFGIVFFLSLSLCMVIFSFYGAQASVFQKARETVLDFFEPVLTVVGAPVRWVNMQVGDVEDYFRVHAENKRLQEENAELRVWMQEALTLRRQLSYYETVLATQLPEPAKYIDAKVIGENGGPFEEALILSAGGNDGVKTGSAVVDDGGLLGHVITTGDGASRVLLLTDYNSRVPVFIEDLEIEALLAGQAKGTPILEFFAERTDSPIRPGQRLVTSGAGGNLPRGIPVGEIESVNGEDVRVRLFANHRTPDLVRVVDFTFPQNVPEEPEAILTDG